MSVYGMRHGADLPAAKGARLCAGESSRPVLVLQPST